MKPCVTGAAEAGGAIKAALSVGAGAAGAGVMGGGETGAGGGLEGMTPGGGVWPTAIGVEDVAGVKGVGAPGCDAAAGFAMAGGAAS